MAIDVNEVPEATITAGPKPRLRWWQVAVFAVVMVLLALVAWQMGHNGPLAAAQVGAGERAPDFTVQTFDGKTVNLADLHGKVVLVNFWASWCIPCSQEAPALESTWRQYQDRGVVFVGVDYVDTETEAKNYLNHFDVTYANGADLGTRISQAYRIRGVPETYIIDQKGILRATFIGPTTQDQLKAKIDQLLAK